jgi:ABC-type sugar transport system ATPase subunit
MVTVELDQLVKQYPGTPPTVSGISLAIAEGEFMVLVGPSGCGKSTTLRMIAGLEEISSGELRIGGQRMNEVHPKDRNISMVFQSYALYPHLSVRDNLGFGLKMRNTPKAELDARVAEVAQMMDLGPLLERKPRELSGGQRQRVAMGRAIARRTPVLLFDEPLSNLDAKLRVQMRAEIAKLHKRLRPTIVYVTHDQVEAMTLADRIAVLHAGRLQQVAPPMELYRHPANRFVAGFIGSPAMNFAEAHIHEGVLSAWGTRIPLPTGFARQSGPCVVGVRPEHLRTEASPTTAALEVQVDLLEPHGAETFASGTCGHDRLVARLAPSVPVQVDALLPLQVEPAHLHLFAPGDNGAALTPED